MLAMMAAPPKRAPRPMAAWLPLAAPGSSVGLAPPLRVDVKVEAAVPLEETVPVTVDTPVPDSVAELMASERESIAEEASPIALSTALETLSGMPVGISVGMAVGISWAATRPTRAKAVAAKNFIFAVGCVKACGRSFMKRLWLDKKGTSVSFLGGGAELFLWVSDGITQGTVLEERS